MGLTLHSTFTPLRYVGLAHKAAPSGLTMRWPSRLPHHDSHAGAVFVVIAETVAPCLNLVGYFAQFLKLHKLVLERNGAEISALPSVACAHSRRVVIKFKNCRVSHCSSSQKSALSARFRPTNPSRRTPGHKAAGRPSCQTLGVMICASTCVSSAHAPRLFLSHISRKAAMRFSSSSTRGAISSKA